MTCVDIESFAMDDFFMGYATLETALVGQWIDTKEARLQGNATVAIVDTIDADGSFLIHHFLDNQLKSPNAVVLVAFSQILNHYALIARKRVGHQLMLVVKLIFRV